jgi:hypothetical protein
MNYKEIISSSEAIEPETLVAFFPKLTSLDRQKIQVLWLLKHTRAAYEDMDVFEKVVLVLNDIDPDVTKMEGSTPEFIWKAINTIKAIHPKVTFSEEVTQYIKYIFNNDGLRFYPEQIGIDNPKITAIKKLASNGSTPLTEDYMGIQTMHYLRIHAYLKETKEGD